MEKAKIIILAGQSNAVGVGLTKYLKNHFDTNTVKKFYDGYDNVLINYYSHAKESNGFVKTTVNCTETAKDSLGPEVGIAKKLTELYPDQKFYIVKYAVGGVNLRSDWLSPSNGAPYSKHSIHTPDILERLSGTRPDAGWCYNGLVNLLTKSIADLTDKGLQPEVSAFFWMQGESDACEREHLDAYINRYDNLLNDLKKQFDGYFDNCTFVDAGISEICWPLYKEMNEQKKNYATEKGYKFIDTIANGLTTKNEPIEQPDLAHYDCASVVRLGELFVEKFHL